MTKSILTLAAGIIVMLAACRKDSGSNQTANSTTANKIAVSEASLKIIATNPAANPENPYDYFGYYHNVGLDSLRNYVKVNNDTTRAGKYAYLHGYFKSNFGVDVNFSYNPLEKLACTNYQAIWFNQKISVNALAYWHALSDAVQSITDLDHYDHYKQEIMAIENKINTDPLPASEKKNLLIASSILRYSAYYWINAFKMDVMIYHNPAGDVDMPDGIFRKIAGVITGICADGSIVAAALISQDYEILGGAELWSEICGYYTGWY